MHNPTTGLVIVAGLPAGPVTRLVGDLVRAEPGTVAVHHDLTRLREGIVLRLLRGATGPDQTSAVELAHGCVSCTLRENVLPALADLAANPAVRRIVLHLDPRLEPEPICWAVRNVVLDRGCTVAELVRIEAVLGVLDAGTWLADATSDEDLTERGLAATEEDDRTVAQLAVGHAEFADAVLLSGPRPHGWVAARTAAVLDRLAPTAVRARLGDTAAAELLTAIPDGARRGREDDPHDPLVRGNPSLEPDCGCALTVYHARRPFHPERLHTAIDALLDGVVRTRGRFWLASQPDTALWLESAGGGLRVAHAGSWLAALPDAAWDEAPAERRALAAARWDPRYGDRAQELAILTHRADPDDIRQALDAALLTDDEITAGWDSWTAFPDPFGQWHTDPCTDLAPTRPLDTAKDIEQP